METPPQTVPAFTPRYGEEGPGRPRMSAWAPVALLAGLVSAVAMIGPMFWSIAGAALVLCVIIKIHLNHHRGELAGERLATLGLALSLIFVTAAPARHVIRHWHLRQQSADVGTEWLYYLVRKEPYNAYESMRPVAMRRPLTSQLESVYASDKNEALAYSYFLNNPIIKAIGLLTAPPPEPETAAKDNGDNGKENENTKWQPPRRVQVRHYQTESIETNSDGADIISDVFALTWDGHDGKPESMLVRLQIERVVDPTRVAALWRILSYEVVKQQPASRGRKQ